MNCDMSEDVGTKMDKGTLRWFGHIERTNGRRLTTQIYEAIVDGYVAKDRHRKAYLPRKNWDTLISEWNDV